MSRIVTWHEFAEYLRNIRQQYRISQRQLGEKLGCSQHHLWRLEHGDRHPSKALLRLLRRDFLLNPEDLFLFDAFEELVAYRCDFVEMEEKYPYFPPRHGDSRAG